MERRLFNLQEDKIPKIFISYSWSSDSIVVPLAQRLVLHGVDVVLDKWDLKEGQDKYAFMEQCVNDPDITRVLIVCDKQYADKADLRVGGVGDETVIISSEIYGKVKQEKFIPIIAEWDENGNPYVPTYIKTRIYIDLSNEDTFETEYEKLLRNIYDKPTYRKPKLGVRPEWLNDEKTQFFSLQDLIRQIKGNHISRKQEMLINQFVFAYIDVLKTYYVKGLEDGKQIFESFIEMKIIRDIFLDFLSVLVYCECDYANILCDTFEKMYNTLTCVCSFDENENSYNEMDIEIYKIHIWELFICTTALLRYNQDYKTLNTLLTNTYFLIDSMRGGTYKPTNYTRFRHYSRVVEDNYKPVTENKNKFTLLGSCICCEREKRPIYTKESLAQADLFLYQVFNALGFVNAGEKELPDYWFPTCYIYSEKGVDEWQKMKSKKICKKMFELFGVDNIETLKKTLANCTYDTKMKYQGSFEAAPTILNYIKIEEIGIMN